MTGAEQRTGMNLSSVAMPRRVHRIDSNRTCGVTTSAVARAVPSLPLDAMRTAGSNSGLIRVLDGRGPRRHRQEAATITGQRRVGADQRSIGIMVATTMTTNRSTSKSRAACDCPNA